MSNLRSTENDLILNLNTLYPYGLNDRLEKPLYVDTEKEILNNACVYKLFLKITHTRKHRGSKNAHHNTISHDIDLDMYYDDILQYYLKGDFNKCKSLICNLRIPNVIKLGNLLSTKISNYKGIQRWCAIMIIDLYKYYRNRKVNYLDFRRNTFSKSTKKPKNNDIYSYIIYF